MKRATVYFLAVIGLSSYTYAANIPCTYAPKEGAPRENITLIVMDDGALIRMRFTGASPDRYFARAAKGNEFVQFATRDGQNGLLNLKKVNSSRMSVRLGLGGNFYTWANAGSVFELNCVAH